MKPATLQRLRDLNAIVDKRPTALVMCRDVAQYDVLPDLMMEHRKEILRALETVEGMKMQPDLFTTKL